MSGPSTRPLYDIAGGTLGRLTFAFDHNMPRWTLDRDRVTFRSSQTGPVNLFWQAGAGGARRSSLPQASTDRRRSPGRPTERSWSFMRGVPRPETTFAYREWTGSGPPSRFCRHPSTSSTPCPHPTADGSPTSPISPVETRSTFLASPPRRRMAGVDRRRSTTTAKPERPRAL